MENALIEAVNDLGIGEDLIPDRFNQTLYTSVTGLGKMTIEAAEIPDDTTDANTVVTWSNDPIEIPANEFAQTQAVSVLFVQN